MWIALLVLAGVAALASFFGVRDMAHWGSYCFCCMVTTALSPVLFGRSGGCGRPCKAGSFAALRMEERERRRVVAFYAGLPAAGSLRWKAGPFVARGVGEERLIRVGRADRVEDCGRDCLTSRAFA